MKTAIETFHEEPKYIDETILEAKICWMVSANIENILVVTKDDNCSGRKGKNIDSSDSSLFKDLVKEELKNNKMLVFFQDLIDQKTGKQITF
jgi:hypothetical protein